jgi:hypothetical protein
MAFGKIRVIWMAQIIAMAAREKKYYKFAADRGLSEAKLNHPLWNFSSDFQNQIVKAVKTSLSHTMMRNQIRR